MLNISELSKKSINQMLKVLEDGDKLSASLPGGGLIHIEENLPFLIVYRKRKNDAGTQKLVVSEASYLIIGNSDFEDYRKLLTALIDSLCSSFKSYMVFEIYTGESSDCFTIKAPAKRLSSTVEVLEDELKKLNEKFSELPLKTKIEDTFHRQKEGFPDLLTVKEAKKLGALVMGLEVPPVFRSEKGELYPVFLRQFRDYLTICIHKAIFNYSRIQTTSGVGSYLALGRTHLKDKVFEVDRALSKIERSYQFLWLVSPANIRDIKDTFFESNYEKVIDYHYRILPIDPDVLKRKLYNLKIEDIDDPAMSHIFRQKREELDHQITMLNERGSQNFFYNSIRLYKGITQKLNSEAKEILKEVAERDEKDGGVKINAEDFGCLAREEFDNFSKQDSNFKSKVHIREDVNIIMVNKGELFLPSDYKMLKLEANALIQHEVGTHILTHHNGICQPLELMSSGLADYDPLQEGLAVMSEYIADGLTPNRLRTLAGRVIAGSARLEGADFLQIFRLLKMNYDFSADRAFNITSRIMQGGGFLKDIIYLKGLVQLREHLQKGGDYESLLSGKFALQHTQVIEELTKREILKPGILKPSYLSTQNFKEKIKLIREGLPLSKMITT